MLADEDHDPREVLALMQEYGISARLTFSNSLLAGGTSLQIRNAMLCVHCLQRTSGVQNGVIIHSDLLLDYLKEKLSGIFILFLPPQRS